MRTKFEGQMEELNTMLIEMGALIERSIDMSVSALKAQDIELAKETIAADILIDQQEKTIEATCLNLLLKQQPVASDLRLISSALKMITDMERIGDQAADIAEMVILLADTPYVKTLEHIPQMAEATAKMVTESIDAFVEKNLTKAQTVIESDDIVDELFDTVKADLIELIQKNVEKSSQAMDLLMVAKYFERIGDHAENIAEWVVFSITGKHNTAQ